MAVIKDESASGIRWEVRFKDYKYGWVEYDFGFFYGEIPVFNPAICEREYFFANVDEKDSLIPLLEKALALDQRVEWRTLETFIYLEIQPYHKRGWKDRNVNPVLIYAPPEAQAELEEVDRLREALGGKLPDDFFQFTFSIDAIQLKTVPGSDSRGFCGTGPGVRIAFSRAALQEFTATLKKEYQQFSEKFKDEMKEEDDCGIPSPL